MATNKENYINRDFSHDRDRFDKSIQINARAMIIADEISKGTKYRQIVSKYMNEWGVSYNYMHSIITESINMFKSEEIWKNIRDINLDRLTEIYQKAMDMQDLDTAIKAVDKINKTSGVYDTEKPVVQVQAEDSNVVITFGGETIDQVEAKRNKTQDVPYSEVDQLINGMLEKKNDE